MGDTVLASGGLITGAEGEGAGEAILVSNPGLVGATSLGPGERERLEGASRRGGEVSGVVSSGARVSPHDKKGAVCFVETLEPAVVGMFTRMGISLDLPKREDKGERRGVREGVLRRR